MPDSPITRSQLSDSSDAAEYFSVPAWRSSCISSKMTERKGQRRQHALPPAQKQVVHDVHVRFRQVVGLQPTDRVHAWRFAVHPQETQRFLLPVAGQVRGRNHQRGQ
ncbi:MAG: hypothetical protein ACLTXW_13440 [Christensenellales bacterium]